MSVPTFRFLFLYKKHAKSSFYLRSFWRAAQLARPLARLPERLTHLHQSHYNRRIIFKIQFVSEPLQAKVQFPQQVLRAIQ